MQRPLAVSSINRSSAPACSELVCPTPRRETATELMGDMFQCNCPALAHHSGSKDNDTGAAAAVSLAASRAEAELSPGGC